MKKVIPFVWSLGVGSALALFLMKPLKRSIFAKRSAQDGIRRDSSDDEIYYI